MERRQKCRINKFSEDQPYDIEEASSMRSNTYQSRRQAHSQGWQSEISIRNEDGADQAVCSQ